MKRPRPATVLLLALIVVLGYAVIRGQRREARLREALARYRSRAGDGPEQLMYAKLPLDWPDGTTLAEAVKAIADSPQARFLFPRGVPILVDTDGLREAGRSLDSPLRTPPKDPATGEALRLWSQLQTVLEPLGLAAEVRNGIIVITSRERMDR